MYPLVYDTLRKYQSLIEDANYIQVSLIFKCGHTHTGKGRKSVCRLRLSHFFFTFEISSRQCCHGKPLYKKLSFFWYHLPF